MKSNSEKTPKELYPVLAKIEQITDLGKSEWYEVVYFDGDKWQCYSHSKTFHDGEKVINWKYCKDVFSDNDKKLKPLTLEYAIKNHFSPIDCIKYFKPEWSDEQCDIYLWEFTSFPLSIETMINQLNKKFIK